MASRLSTYVQKEALLKQLQEELQALESDEDLKREIEFKEKLDKLITEYNQSYKEVIALLDPNGEVRGLKSDSKAPATGGGVRRKRKLKVYKNPNTGEVVETRGGNHKTLKAWKDEHGAKTVESWVQEERD